ncbi:hypothetical protein SDC9_207037 [bioreactor metagenome]|uniref:Uncharacterized protein n=1 Tax=bioreactor metagenome TaxID=1076179 RepID=A0A645J7B0_9ZZZZ
MLTNLFAVHGNDFTRLRWQITAQKFAELTFADKANAGRIFFLRGNQSQVFGNFAHLRFFQFADREQTLCDLLMAQRVEEVALIFIAI